MSPTPVERSLALAAAALCASGAILVESAQAQAPVARRTAQRTVAQPAPAIAAAARLAPASRAVRLEVFEFSTAVIAATGDVESTRSVQARAFVERLGAGVRLELVAVPGGELLMGSPETEIDHQATEGPQRTVRMRGFLIGKFEVTQAQWRAVAMLPKVAIDISPEPSGFTGDDLPVGIVSWDDVQEFLARLSKATGRTYRLPSEAEWEYACRAGSNDPFAFGPTLTPEIANVAGEIPYGAAPTGATRGTPVDVGSLGVANGFGIFDMHGNASEWCADSWQATYDGAPLDGSPRADANAIRRVIRGGSYKIFAGYCRSAARAGYERDFRMDHVGFRVACDLPQ
jgi:formylglycine-generating enzyme required for sulfatase activity